MAGRDDEVANMTEMKPSDRPRIEIEYCTQCRWLLRAAWMAQELLLTFEQEVSGVTLIPGAGGIFEIRVRDRCSGHERIRAAFSRSRN